MLAVDPSSTVLDFKLLVQANDPAPPEQRSNPRIRSADGVSPDFQRLFFGNNELGDSCTLEHYNVEEDSSVSFAVRAAVGKKLRKAMLELKKDPLDLDETGDDRILGVVMGILKDRMLVSRPENYTGSTDLTDKLYAIFKPNFSTFDNVSDGCLTLNKEHGEAKSGYVHWAVNEHFDGAYPYKTHHGIPVYPRLYGRKP